MHIIVGTKFMQKSAQKKKTLCYLKHVWFLVMRTDIMNLHVRMRWSIFQMNLLLLSLHVGHLIFP